MASQVNPPRGMRDFLPAEKNKREQVLSIIRQSYRSHGFDEIETPVAEESSRLHAGLGGDNEKLAFGILKRGLTEADLHSAKDPIELTDLGLRFDLTVPLSRFYATHRAELPSVFRSIQLGPVWRAERPQKGRYRQFVQCDIDIIGEPGVIAEAELVIASLSTFRALGLDQVSIRVNDRRILIGMLEHFGFPAEEHSSVLISLDKLDKLGADGVIEELEQISKATGAIAELAKFFRRPQTLEFNPFGERQIRKALPQDFDSSGIADLIELGRIVESAGVISADGLPLVFDPFLVRGMGYYTGIIMEAMHPSADYSLGGGGRYDGMIGRFLGVEVPATGFSIGFERIIDLLDLKAHSATSDAVLLYDKDSDPAVLLKLKNELVAGGSRVRLELARRNLKAFLNGAYRDGFRRFGQVGSATSAKELQFRDLTSPDE